MLTADEQRRSMFDQLVAAGADPDDAQAAAQILAAGPAVQPWEFSIIHRVWGQLQRAGRVQ